MVCLKYEVFPLTVDYLLMLHTEYEYHLDDSQSSICPMCKLKEAGSLIQYTTLVKADSQAWLHNTKVMWSSQEAASKFIHTRTLQKSC